MEFIFFFFSSRRRHTSLQGDWSSDVCSSDLEPVGQVPDLSRMNPEMLNANLGALRSSMSTLLITHYFVTEEMRSELGRGNLGGTLPIHYVFFTDPACTV